MSKAQRLLRMIGEADPSDYDKGLLKALGIQAPQQWQDAPPLADLNADTLKRRIKQRKRGDKIDAQAAKLLMKACQASPVKVSPERIDTFLRGYMESALFSSTDPEGQPLDQWFDIDDMPLQASERMRRDCAKFMGMAGSLLDAIDDERAGTLFWWNRNGHGSGFWDEDGLDPAVQKTLSQLSKKFGEQHLELNPETGELYVM